MRAFLLSLLWLLAGPALAQEKLVGTNMDVRTILNFKVADAAIQKLLPPGWEANPATSGPSAGANLRVTFVDQMAAHDAAGKPTPPVRNLIFGIPVRKPGSEDRRADDFRRAFPRRRGALWRQHEGDQRCRAQGSPRARRQLDR